MIKLFVHEKYSKSKNNNLLPATICLLAVPHLFHMFAITEMQYRPPKFHGIELVDALIWPDHAHGIKAHSILYANTAQQSHI